MIRLAAITLALSAGPALAAGDYPFFSLRNTDLVVLIGFVIFVGILVYFKVPGILAGVLDKRAETIRAELEEARRLREEAQQLRSSFERKKDEVKDQAERIIARAREDAETAAQQAREELEASIARRMKAAEDQIVSAETAALRAVHNRAVAVAVKAAGDVIGKSIGKAEADRLVNDSIKTVEARLH